MAIDDNTEFNYMVPISLSDGNMIFLNPKSGAVNLIFYQNRQMTGGHIDKLDVVAAVYMASVNDLKEYRKAIDGIIKEYEQKEK